MYVYDVNTFYFFIFIFLDKITDPSPIIKNSTNSTQPDGVLEEGRGFSVRIFSNPRT